MVIGHLLPPPLTPSARGGEVGATVEPFLFLDGGGEEGVKTDSMTREELRQPDGFSIRTNGKR